MHSTNYDNNTAASTWWLRNASFLRLKNIEVGYNFKEKTLKKIGIQGFACLSARKQSLCMG